MNLDRMVDKERGRRIRSAIREVLMGDWDPIGVKDEPLAADEYDMYLGDIYGLLVDEAAEISIASHLREIEIKRMGFADFQTPGPSRRRASTQDDPSQLRFHAKQRESLRARLQPCR